MQKSKTNKVDFMDSLADDVPESLFGIWKKEKKLDLSDLRDESEPHD